MKKRKLFLAVFFIFNLLEGAPIGNPAFPAILGEGFLVPSRNWVHLRLGYEGDFVSDAKMEQYNQGSGRVDSDQQRTQSGMVVFDFLGRLDLYGVFGSSWMKANWRFETGGGETITRIELKTNSDFLWAAGGRAILYQWGPASLGFGGRYTTCSYGPSSLKSNGASQPIEHAEVDWSEWQIDLGLCYKIDLFTPYIGFKYSHAETLLKQFPVPIGDNSSLNNSFKNRVPVGVYLGCALSTGRYFVLNLEGRLVDEEAVTVSADLGF